jgi:hypothetical protein
MNDDDLEQRMRAYGSRWRDAHPFPADVDLSRLARRTRWKTALAIVATAAVVIGAVGIAAAVRHDASSNAHPVSPPSTLTTTLPTTSTTLRPPRLIPSPQPTPGQITVRADPTPEPLAVGNGRVWMGTPSGIDAVDLVTLKTIGNVPIALPVLSIASTSDGVWVLSGSDESLDVGGNPPYRLERIDPSTLHVEFSADLPYAVGYRTDENVRLAAAAGTAWVALGTTVLRVGARTNVMKSISLSGHYEANIAADDSGLWVECGGTDGHVQDVPLLHIDAATNAVTSTPGLPAGFYWSIATTPNAVWLLASTGENADGLSLMRIDPATHAIRNSRVPGISLVTGDGQLWAQIFQPESDSLNFDDLVGQIDTTTGQLTRTVRISIGEVNGSSGNGYAAPPFAVANGSIWSGYAGLQRTPLSG